MKTQEISRIGRLTKGVRLMRLDDNVSVVSIACTEESDEATENELTDNELTQNSEQ